MATATRVGRTRQAKGMNVAGALDMTRTKGGNTYTYYQCGVIDQARDSKVGIRIIKRGKPFLTTARRVHRQSLTDTFGDPHDNAGQGKYIKASAIEGKVVTGAQNVNPYLATEGSYAASITALQSRISPRGAIGKLVADLHKNRADGEHLVWRGRVNSETGALLVSDWLTAAELYEIACEIAPSLPKRLRAQKSQVEGVEEHLTPLAKFEQNLNVMRRGRSDYSMATGETDEACGGATPYAMPLEQCGFAIDMAYLTTAVDDNGEESGQYHYRLAIGRSVPWTLDYRSWRGMSPDQPIAYRDETVRQRALKFAKKTRK